MGKKKPKTECWNNKVKAIEESKHAAWECVLRAEDKIMKERYMEIYKLKEKAGEQFGRMMNKDVN